MRHLLLIILLSSCITGQVSLVEQKAFFNDSENINIVQLPEQAGFETTTSEAKPIPGKNAIAGSPARPGTTTSTLSSPDAFSTATVPEITAASTSTDTTSITSTSVVSSIASSTTTITATTTPTTTAPQLSASMDITPQALVRGNHVNITVMVSYGGAGLDNAEVSTKITYASGSNQTNVNVTDSSGRYLWRKQIGGNSKTGTFAVQSVISKEGYGNATAGATFLVVSDDNSTTTTG